jgi:carbamate kinase
MTVAVVALGGNAILKSNERGTSKEQINHVNESVRQIGVLLKKYDIVIVHGNGPQVGNILVQQEKSKYKIPPMPLDVCGAMTQGQIGYFLQMSIGNILKKPALSVITRVLVNEKDPSFKKPTKPIGPYYSKKIKKNMIKELAGWRRVVASPKPVEIIEAKEIRTLIERGYIVITCGGGGIPVILKKGKLVGIEAVIDKDFAAQKLASQLKAECLIILTDVKNVYINYCRKDQRPLGKITAKELTKYLKEGQFKEGSMKPKIEASLKFLANGGKKVIITDLLSLKKALNDQVGTIITK